MILGGGWFCGGAEAVRRDSGELEVHPPEEHASSITVYWVKGFKPLDTASVDKPV